MSLQAGDTAVTGSGASVIVLGRHDKVDGYVLAIYVDRATHCVDAGCPIRPYASYWREQDLSAA